MLSQQQDQYEEEQPEDVYVRGYKPTDIFNLAPLANVPGKRQIVDRNRSSVFGNNSDDGNLAQSASKPDRMKSDIFFGGNSASTARFGGYEPSVGTSNSRRSSAKDLYERQHQQQQQAPLHDDAVQYSSNSQQEGTFRFRFHRRTLALALFGLNSFVISIVLDRVFTSPIN